MPSERWENHGQMASTKRVWNETVLPQISLKQFRNNTAYIGQDLHFFNRTIRENLLLANPFANDDQIKISLITARVWNEVKDLPDGVDTMFTPDLLKNTSNYFLVKLCVARVYIKNARFIIVDELPFSFLNSPDGKAFYETLRSWKGSRTIFVVTYREDYLRLADQVFHLRAGKYVNVYKPDEFLDKMYDNVGAKNVA